MCDQINLLQYPADSQTVSSIPRCPSETSLQLYTIPSSQSMILPPALFQRHIQRRSQQIVIQRSVKWRWPWRVVIYKSEQHWCWQQYRSCIIWEVALSRNHEWIMECSHLTEYSQIDDSFCHKSWNSQLFQEGSVRSSSGMYVSWQLLMLSVFSHLCGSTDFSTYYHEDKSHSSVSSCEWTFVSSTGGLPDCAVTMAGRSFGHGECTDHVTRTQIGRRWLQSGVNSSEWFPRMKWD